MSHIQNPLPLKDLFGIVRPVELLSQRVRLRLREEMKRKNMSQRDVAGLLDWSQSRVAHMLTGRVEIGVDDLAGFAFALGVSVTELVRDQGMEFCADMTPTELRIHDTIRALSVEQRAALLTLLNIRSVDRPTARPPQKTGDALALCIIYLNEGVVFWLMGL
jgi:transcriptional regulator with XRE-family HTH domain